jgi:two-component system, OmpR family, alkaline phosphatase synthesis response regulator PhoP
MSRVLVVEDEAHLAQGLRFNLEAEGHTVEVAGDGESALDRLLGKKQSFDVVILDVMLPGKNGFDVAALLRENKNYTPILMLTARGRAEDVLHGFASGADDYLPKPFELAILIARLDSLLRRTAWIKQGSKDGTHEHVSSRSPVDQRWHDHQPGDDSFNFAGKSIDFDELELRSLGDVIHLTLMEAELLRHLVRNQGRVVSRKSILEEVWGLHEDTDTRAIDNFIVRLRRYIEEDPSSPKHLQTVRGVGYRFIAEPK